MPFCPKCNDHYILNHVCGPAWECREFETKWQNDWTEVRAHDAERAAEKFCEMQDRGGDYDVIRRGSAEVEVRQSGSEEIKLIDVWAESVPQYHGRVRQQTAVG